MSEQDAGTGQRLESVPVAQLKEHPKNPRKVFAQADLDGLAASMIANGVLVPLRVRPIAGKDGAFSGKYEIGAGHRRYRAAKLARLASVPCIIEDMDDDTMASLLYVENLQRADVHPLDEAKGYSDWMKVKKLTIYEMARIAGKPERYIYDTLRLLKLNENAQELYKAGKIERAHAVILARLSATDQQTAIDDVGRNGKGGGLFEIEIEVYEDMFTEGEKSPMKTRSARELQSWIDKHIRFNATADVVPELFPEAHKLVTESVGEKKKILSVTELYYTPPSARDAEERTYGSMSWRDASTKPCKYARAALVVVGPHRGDARTVCINRKECKVHWSQEVKLAEAKARSKEQGEDNVPTLHNADDEWKVRRAWNETLCNRAELSQDAIQARVVESLKSMAFDFSDDATAPLLQLIVDSLDDKAMELMGGSVNNADDMLRVIILDRLLSDEISDHSIATEPEELSTLLGFDVEQLVEEVAGPKPPMPPQLLAAIQRDETRRAEHLEWLKGHCDSCEQLREACECEDEGDDEPVDDEEGVEVELDEEEEE